MRANWLQLNLTKTDVLGSSLYELRQNQIPSAVRIGDTPVSPVSSVRDLWVYLDADLTMTAHVNASVRACFAAMRQIRSVRRSLAKDALLTLLGALVVSKVDCCSTVLGGISG